MSKGAMLHDLQPHFLMKGWLLETSIIEILMIMIMEFELQISIICNMKLCVCVDLPTKVCGFLDAKRRHESLLVVFLTSKNSM